MRNEALSAYREAFKTLTLTDVNIKAMWGGVYRYDRLHCD